MKLERNIRNVLFLFLAGIVMALAGYQVGKWLAIAAG